MPPTTGSASAVVDQLLARLEPPPRSLRSIRYRGDDRAVRLSELAATDRDGVRALHDALSGLHAVLAARRAVTDVDAAASVVAAFDYDAAMSAARTLGRGDGAPLSDEVRRALHDVRGGALTSLLVELSRLRARRATDGPRALEALSVLTSDHLKIMRNALLELDDAKREADLAPCPHVVGRLVESLARVTAERPEGGGTVSVNVRCSFSGAITMSCVELGALDRATLNLVNNAVRHAAGDRVEVALLPVADVEQPDLRVVVANRLGAADARAIVERFGGDRGELGRLFVEPFSTTGSGDGLKICLDFVSAAYGLARGTDAIGAGIVGAAVEDAGGEPWFLAWLHWPSVA